MDSNQILTNSLTKAATSLDPNDLEAFFIDLLNYKVFIPVKAKLEKIQVTKIIGESNTASLPYLFLNSQDQTLLPIFSEEEFLVSWAEREMATIEEKLTTLLWQLPPNTWLHLNPNQEIGKEFSPIEVELLKQGKKAIPDLIAIALEDEQEDYEIELPSDNLLKLQPALIPVLELYPELTEAFLLSIKESSSNTARALVGLKYSSDIQAEQKNYIRSEIERTAQEFLISPFTGVFIVDDLGNNKSPNQSLFLDFKPFYQKYD